MPRILFADYDYPEIGIETELFARHGIDVRTAQCRTEDDVIAAAKGCFGILLQYAPISGRVVAALPELAVVSRIGAGFDTVDTQACEKLGIWVANSPDYGIGEVATHALALSLALIRNVVAYNRDIAAGTWSFLSSGTLRRPREMTLGIVGLGRIGKRMAHISRETFKRVVAFDPFLIDGDFPSYVERAPTLESLAASADVVSIHTPLTAQTRGLIDGRFLAGMPDGGYLVNTARGAIVDVAAVLAALDSGKLSGAALDVLPDEPVSPESRLLGHPRVILTPHAAFYSMEAERELRRKAAQNLVSWLATGRPDYVVARGSRTPDRKPA